MSVVIPVGMNQDVVNRLMLARDVALRTGALHELLARHLKVWGMAALNTTAIELRYCREDLSVEFRVTSDKFYRQQPPDNLTNRLTYLDGLVRWLMGPEHRVEAIIDSEVVWNQPGAGCQTSGKSQDSTNEKVKS